MVEAIRILHVFGSTNRGGAEMRTLEVMRHVDRSRFQFDYCVLSGQPGTLDEEIRVLGGEVHPCRLGIAFPWRFRRLLREGRFDVVHAHLHHFSGLILRLAAQRGVPTRVAHFRSCQDGHADGWRRAIQRSLMRHWIDRYATRILSVSEAAMEDAWGRQWRSDPRCEIVYNGLSLAPFELPADREGVRREFGLPADCLLAIHVGRLVAPKNHARLIGIFQALRQRRPEARLLVVGSGPEETQRGLQQRIADLGVEKEVVFAGERGDVARLLKAADVLVFPSLWEGLPGVVLEACAAGTPVAASDLPALREIAGRFPRVRCLSLDRADAEWARLIEDLVEHRPSDPLRQAACRTFAGSLFTIDRCVERLCRVWQGPALPAAAGGTSHG